MKATTLLTLLGSLACVGCTVYPKNYTYSPTVTVNGSEGGDAQVNLPSPFAKNSKPASSYSRAQRYTEQQYYPSQVTNVNLYPYIPAHQAQPLVVEPDSFAAEHAAVVSRNIGRDLDGELGTYIIP